MTIFCSYLPICYFNIISVIFIICCNCYFSICTTDNFRPLFCCYIRSSMITIYTFKNYFTRTKGRCYNSIYRFCKYYTTLFYPTCNILFTTYSTCCCYNNYFLIYTYSYIFFFRFNFIINTQDIRNFQIFFSSICRTTFGNKYSS